MENLTGNNPFTEIHSLFAHSTAEGRQRLAIHLQGLLDALNAGHMADVKEGRNPYSGHSPERLGQIMDKFPVFPKDGIGMQALWRELGEEIWPHQLQVEHPRVMAHLHCPTLLVSSLAELLIGMSNQSMDSWDQAPLATVMEEKVIRDLCQKIDELDPEAKWSKNGDGVFTSGGTQSNLMGCLLARDFYSRESLHWSIRKRGLPLESQYWRVFCSETTHFSIKKSLSLLGLGEDSIVPVKVNGQKRICLATLERALRQCKQQGHIPIMLVGSAGSTDFGAIDPLDFMGEIARKWGMWFHVDAAYGGGLLFSQKHFSNLQGLQLADSLTLDFHKMLYQSISCSVFLVKDNRHFDLLKEANPYLNREEDEDIGIPNLVNKSIQTTRRFDALKVYMSFRALGQKTFGDLMDATIELTRQSFVLIESHQELELFHQGPLNVVTFRYRGKSKNFGSGNLDFINQKIRQELLQSGWAIIGQTTFQGKIYLKLTLINPLIGIEDIKTLLEMIIHKGNELNQRVGHRCHPRVASNGS